MPARQLASLLVFALARASLTQHTAAVPIKGVQPHASATQHATAGPSKGALTHAAATTQHPTAVPVKGPLSHATEPPHPTAAPATDLSVRGHHHHFRNHHIHKQPLQQSQPAQPAQPHFPHHHNQHNKLPQESHHPHHPRRHHSHGHRLPGITASDNDQLHFNVPNIGQLGTRSMEAGLKQDPTKSSRTGDFLDQRPTDSWWAGWRSHEPSKEAVSISGTTLHEGFLRQVPSNASAISDVLDRRLKESSLFLGWISLLAGITLLCMNESRVAALRELVHKGQKDIKTVPVDAKSTRYNGQVVHVQGISNTAAAVSDERFENVVLSDCIKLTSKIEVYQWCEITRNEVRERFEGESEMVTSYQYRMCWSSSEESSDNFTAPEGHLNPPLRLSLGDSNTIAEQVRLGSFVLHKDMVQQLSVCRSANDLLPAVIKSEGIPFTAADDGYFYTNEKAISVHGAEVGDMRASFEYVPAGPCTAAGLMKDCALVPHGSVHAGFHGWTKDLLARWHVHSPQICYAAEDYVSIETVFKHFKDATNSADHIKWFFRLLGWLLTFSGFCIMLSPFTKFVAAVPVLGALGGSLMYVICFTLTVAVASTVVVTFYMAYHPRESALVLFAAAAVVTGVSFVLLKRSQLEAAAFRLL